MERTLKQAGDAVELEFKRVNSIMFIMRIVLGCGVFAGLMITAHAATFAANRGAQGALAGAGVSVVNFFSALGRIGGGALCDRISASTVMTYTPLICTHMMQILSLPTPLTEGFLLSWY